MRRISVLSVLAFVVYSLGAILPFEEFYCQAAESRVKKVLFIGIDGVRSDALKAAYTPHLDA